MRKLLIVAIVTTVMSVGGEARAVGERIRAQVATGQGPLVRLREFEQRKNQALRIIILGR